METPLTVKQGEDTPIEIHNVRDRNGVPITNLTGFSAHSQVRPDPASTTVLYEWTSQGGTPNITFVGSTVVLAITAAVSLAWAWSTGRYDVFLTDGAGQKACIGQGPITITPAVTH